MINRQPLKWLVQHAFSFALLCALILSGSMPAAHADLQVLITKGVTDPIPIAVVPFAHLSAGDGAYDVAAVVQQDLDGSGRFRLMKRASMQTQPSIATAVQAADWKAEGNDYVAVGRVSADASGQITILCDLVNTQTGQTIGSQKVIAGAASLRYASHQISDFIYEKILGVRGAFATRIAYVAVQGRAPSLHYQLVVADADGENPKVVLESAQPIMSPTWSADEQWLAYVSFENRLSAVWVQRVRSGERRLVSARAGVNGAPAFSPDGSKLALTLSGSGGNLDIWLLDLGSQQLTRLTEDPAVDTEPTWSADGSTIYFTSDRAGGPQIYRLNIAQPKRVERVTFGSGYNARPRLSPDGKKLAYVTRDGSAYRIAVQDLASNTVSVLSHGNLDESPSFAPNGATIIYSGRDGEIGSLETVSTDGLVSQRLRSAEGEVREPVWGPFAH